MRLLPRWERISRYEDPEGWVRLVAFRLLSNRRRRARNYLAALRRLDRPPLAPAPSTDGVDVWRALAVLPAAQRRLVVLHYLLDLPVEEIASRRSPPVVRIPSGTVKSRLARARRALEPLLRVETTEVTEHA